MADMDQVLLIIAASLGDFLLLVGGNDFAHSLASILERLCCSEDVAVRTTAASSTCKILASLSQKDSVSIQSFYEFYQRLCSEDGEIFYGRMSACQLTPDIYRLISASEKSVVLDLFNKLLSDDLPMVRRGAGQAFVKLATVMDADFPVTVMTKMMKDMVSDGNSAVRAIAYEVLGPFSAKLKSINVSQANLSELAVLIKTAVDDPSWKIRQVAAKKYGIFPSCFPPNIINAEIFPGLMSLLQDAEPDVRISCLEGIVPYVSSLGSSAFWSEFSHLLQHLAEDPVPGVRKALCDAGIDIFAIVSKDVDAQQLSDAISKLVMDEDPLVRLRVLKKIDKIASDIPTLCLKLTESFKRMFRDSNWRVRKQIGYSMPSMVKHLGADHFCDNYLIEFLALLKDGVDEVRVECARIIPNLLSSASNPSWMLEKIFPSIQSLSSEDFLVRLCLLTALQGFASLQLGGLPDSFYRDTLELILSLAKDKVPNIRMRVAQVLGSLRASSFERYESNFKMRTRPVLQDLSCDSDKDVKFFAASALKLYV